MGNRGRCGPPNLRRQARAPSVARYLGSALVTSDGSPLRTPLGSFG